MRDEAGRGRMRDEAGRRMRDEAGRGGEGAGGHGERGSDAGRVTHVLVPVQVAGEASAVRS